MEKNNLTNKKSTKKKESKFLDLKNFDKSLQAAIYYGFLKIDTPEIKKEDKDKVKNLKDGISINKIGSNDRIEFSAEEKSALLRNYFETNLVNMPQPVMVVYNNFINELKEKKQNKFTKIGLEIFGSNKGIAEAIIIKTTLAILEDNGFDDLYVEINSIGDKESNSRFLKELITYYRKHINVMQHHCRQEFKKDPFLVLNCNNEKCLNLKEEAPKLIACLSDESREHFKEVLEYLENLDIPYRINDYLFSDRRYASGTVFEIKQKSNNPKVADQSLAVGYRSDLACKKLGFKKDISTIGVKINFKNISSSPQEIKIKKASVFFIQLGEEAKHKSLKVIDILRKNNIYVIHSLGRDKLSGQMATADRLKVPYVLIMGKKEAMDDTVMVRNTDTRSQETIKITDLAIYLKKLVK